MAPQKAKTKAAAPAVEEASSDAAKAKLRAKGVEQLVALGKEKGFLTYDDINRILPENVTSPNEIDDVLMTLTAQHIEVVDSEDSFTPKDADADSDSDKDEPEEASEPESDAKKEEPEPAAQVSPSRLEQMDDPVRMYLRQMGRSLF